jgi:hypothetical protein
MLRQYLRKLQARSRRGPSWIINEDKIDDRQWHLVGRPIRRSQRGRNSTASKGTTHASTVLASNRYAPLDNEDRSNDQQLKRWRCHVDLSG